MLFAVEFGIKHDLMIISDYEKYLAILFYEAVCISLR